MLIFLIRYVSLPTFYRFIFSEKNTKSNTFNMNLKIQLLVVMFLVSFQNLHARKNGRFNQGGEGDSFGGDDHNNGGYFPDEENNSGQGGCLGCDTDQNGGFDGEGNARPNYHPNGNDGGAFEGRSALSQNSGRSIGGQGQAFNGDEGSGDSGSNLYTAALTNIVIVLFAMVIN